MRYYFTAKQVKVGYQKQPLIEKIEISLEKGKILTIIGPNGAGKTTILRSIARQLPLLGGSLYLEQQCMKEMTGAELSQKMAVVLTDRLRSELMTCEDVVSTGRYPYTGRFGVLSAKDWQKVDEAMEMVQVTELRDRDFRKISDGQRQRVLLARAICQEPEIIILDEPTSYLDVRYKLEFLSALQKMQREKEMTVIMSLHELELAAKVSDQILCVNGSGVDKWGAPEEIFREGYVSELFGLSYGSYDEGSGSLELPKAPGKAQSFVLAGGGTGRNVYRRLQRQGIPFAAGILYENDVDYPVARALAEEVISVPAFEPVEERHLQKAKEKIADCHKVICCIEKFGTLEAFQQELLQYAMQCGIEVERCC